MTSQAHDEATEQVDSLLPLVPHANVAPPDAQPSRVVRRQSALSRRGLLAAVTGGAVAAGLGALDLLPWSKPKGAFAAAYQEWGDCHGYFNSSTICVPSSALYSNTCNGSWHRNDGSSGTGYVYRYYHHPTRCSDRNAWRWTSGTRRKCSDGDYFYQAQGSSGSTRMSICRTAI